MFEITYKESTINDSALSIEGSRYDFTFENRFDIFHRPKGKLLEYIALDRTTGLTSWVTERKNPLEVSEYSTISPRSFTPSSTQAISATKVRVPIRPLSSSISSLR